ncbi:hypothetical protein LWI29_024230 [Acer saccharum]|uniref:Uncharacterized protein n=1 Tax=Acer saccharum TaxID=4024 RepID=A0AA39TH06_ACESA|nr:hypothetical protein LWI29_024230 [Acer saccharum]
MHVGVVGLGGLGHVAVKFAKAMGVKVTVISTSPNKKKEDIEHLGADSFLVSDNQDEIQVGSVMLKKIQLNESESNEMMMIWSLLTQVNVKWTNTGMEVKNQSGAESSTR